MTYYNGICYAPFPPGYNPSIANTTCIFFGSDIAYDPMAPLWGTDFNSSTGSGCGTGTSNTCRDDLATLKEMGVNLIRLYDWDPRNKHRNFLDRCASLGIKVLAPVSNYFVKLDSADMKKQIPILLESFSDHPGGDYHEAIAAIIIGNEPELNNFTAANCVEFTNLWIHWEIQQGYQRHVPIGHPVDFGKYGGSYPCWGFWDPLVNGFKPNWESIGSRLFLAPQTYNKSSYLFVNAQGTNKGYVDLTWERYKLPILFTEIGQDRTKSDYQSTVKGQLSDTAAYAKKVPERIWGTCFFQFADKVWEEGTTEGSFGAFSHGNAMFKVTYGPKDFTHWENNCEGDQMEVDELEPTPLYQVVKGVYTAA
jgi:hypothetical protein